MNQPIVLTRTANLLQKQIYKLCKQSSKGVGKVISHILLPPERFVIDDDLQWGRYLVERGHRRVDNLVMTMTCMRQELLDAINSLLSNRFTLLNPMLMRIPMMTRMVDPSHDLIQESIELITTNKTMAQVTLLTQKPPSPSKTAKTPSTLLTPLV
jgi:hypothetical protein